MADVFLSYKRENLPAVQPLVVALRAAGLTVWWDQDIAPDAPWEQTIEHAHEHAKTVIVAWSLAAVQSENVKAEARRARAQGRLIQIFVEPCEPPMFFGERQGLDFTGWRGSVADGRFKTLLSAIEAIKAGKAPPQGVGYAPRKTDPWGLAWRGVAALSVVVGLVAGFGGARDGVCGWGWMNGFCRALNLAPAPPPPDPAVIARLARRKLIQSLDGPWMSTTGDCAKPMTIATSTGADGIDRLRITYGADFNSDGQIVAAEGGVVSSRDIAVKPGATRDVWEYRPNGDQMTVEDKNGVETHLVRCGKGR